MLCHLTIADFTLVRELDLEFESGMTVVTGETGAGKSIMLDALALALGGRADTAMVATEAQRAEINAAFDLKHNLRARDWLAERDLGDEHECLLRRTVSRDGRSRGFINGTPSTLADMRELGGLLADIHSQHEHQSLLKADTHRRLLDDFADHSGNLTRLDTISRKHRSTSEELVRLTGTSDEGAARLQLLNYQAEELSELALGDNETARLESEQSRLTNAEDNARRCALVIDTCVQNESANASEILRNAIDQLQGIEDSALDGIIELLTSSRIQLVEAVDDLRRLAGNFEADPERLRQVEQRLDTIYDVARKHRVRPEELPARLDDISREIDSLAGLPERIEAAEAILEACRQEYAQVAAELSKSRRTHAGVLAKEVNRRLVDLGMGGASLAVEMPERAGEIHPLGAESIEFHIATNPGQPARPLARVASGGELSRLSLAIQVVAARTSEVPTLVFDEVDVGIGGATAEVVGAMLRELGGAAQIVCVTHLPQVAAQGHHHLHVSKTDAGTSVRCLVENEERVYEIARMLGGVEESEQAHNHARDMFTRGQSDKDRQ